MTFKRQSVVGSLSSVYGCVDGAIPFLLMRPSPIAQPVSVRSSSFATGTGTGTVINKPAGTVQNDVMLVFVSMQAGTAITPPAGWTAIRTQASGTGASLYGMYFKVAGAAEPSTYTFSDSASAGVDLAVGMVTVITTAITINASSTGTSNFSVGSGTRTMSANSITTTQNSCLLFIGLGLQTAGVTEVFTYTDASDFSYANQTQGTIFQRIAVADFPTAGITGNRSANFTKDGASGYNGVGMMAALQII